MLMMMTVLSFLVYDVYIGRPVFQNYHGSLDVGLRLKRKDRIKRSGDGAVFLPKPSRNVGSHHPGYLPLRLLLLINLMMEVLC